MQDEREKLCETKNNKQNAMFVHSASHHANANARAPIELLSNSFFYFVKYVLYDVKVRKTSRFRIILLICSS